MLARNGYAASACPCRQCSTSRSYAARALRRRVVELQDADVTGLSSGVVTIDYGEIRPEPEGLPLRKGVYAPVVEYGQERNGQRPAAVVRYVFASDGNNLPFLGEALGSLADSCELSQIIIRKFAVHDEASQSIALPSRSVLRPFQYFLKDRH